MDGREPDGGRVRAAEAQRREERLGRAHGDAATDLVAAVPWDLAGRLRPYKSK